MKLSECNIKTSQVYVNIIRGDSVETETLSANEAITKYGQMTVISVEESEIIITEEQAPEQLRRNTKANDVKRVSGITNFILQ